MRCSALIVHLFYYNELQAPQLQLLLCFVGTSVAYVDTFSYLSTSAHCLCQHNACQYWMSGFFVRLVQGGFFDASVCDLTDLRFHIFLYNKAGFIPGSDSLKMSPLLFLLYEILTSVCCQTEVSYQISYPRRLDQNTYTKRKRPDWILALYYRRITLKGQVS